MENYEIKKIQCLRNSYFYKLLFIFESWSSKNDEEKGGGFPVA